MNVENKESAICKHCKDPIRRATEKEMGEAKLSEPDWIHSCGFWTCGDDCLEAEPLELAGESGAPAPTQPIPNALLLRLRMAELDVHSACKKDGSGWLVPNEQLVELLAACEEIDKLVGAPVQDSPTKIQGPHSNTFYAEQFVRARWMGDLDAIPLGKVGEFMASFAEQFAKEGK